jgi:hypothetical protein
MKTKIHIKSLFGYVLFEHEAEDNSIKTALEAAITEGANLKGACLKGAKNISQSYINLCSRDILFVLQHLKHEVSALRQLLIDGKVDGTQYEGECVCLFGSLANANGDMEKVCSAIPFYERGLHNYGEQWFWQIREDDTPETNEFAAHALKLIDMLLAEK